MERPADKRPAVLVWHWGRRGGGPRYMFELVRALQARDDIDLHISYSLQAEIAADFAALGLPALAVDTYRGLGSAALASLRLPWIIARFRRYLIEHRIHTVYCAMSHPWNVAVVPFIRGTGARYVLALHDAVPHPGEESRWRMWALARELAATDRVVALTRHVRDQLVALHGYPAEKTLVLPHGVFNFAGGRARTLPATGERPIRLTFFGRILPYKGFDILLDAYARLRAHYGARVVLEVAGSGDITPYAGQLAGLEGVTLHNRWIAEEEIGDFLDRADLVVLPYREASQSGVIPSAYAMGVPVVATSVGGLSEQVIDGVTGYLATETDGATVATAISRIIDDPGSYARLSAQTLSQAQQTLSWPAIADGLVNGLALS